MSNAPMDSVSARFAETVSGELKEVADGIQLLPGFGNTTLIVGDGEAAVVDPGLFQNGRRVVAALRSLTDAPVRYVIYTHGHYDHAFGTPALLEDAAERGHAAPGAEPQAAALPRVCDVLAPLGRPPTPSTTKLSSPSSTATPQAASPWAMAARRSLSLTRSSARPFMTVRPRAQAAATARIGYSSIIEGARSAGT